MLQIPGLFPHQALIFLQDIHSKFFRSWSCLNQQKNLGSMLSSNIMVVFSVVKWFWAISPSRFFSAFPLSWKCIGLQQGISHSKPENQVWAYRISMWTSFRLIHLLPTDSSVTTIMSRLGAMNSAKPNEAGQIWTLFLISADLTATNQT